MRSSQSAYINMMNRLHSGRNMILKPLIEELRKQDHSGSYAKLEELENLMKENSEQVQILTGLRSSGILTPALFTEKNNALQADIRKLKEQRTALQAEFLNEGTLSSEAEELIKYLNRAGITGTFDEDIFSRFVKGITVLSPTEAGFNLKCGLLLRERMVR